jgi:hypothetical protein
VGTGPVSLSSDDASLPICGSSPSFAQVLDSPPKSSEEPSTENLPSTPGALPSNPTPSQPGPQPLSRESTTSSFETSSSFDLNGAGDNGDMDGDGELHRILAMVEEVVDQCRICWVRKEVTHPHRTYRCPTGICSSQEWQTFRANVPFPRDVVCYFCFAPYCPPFNHSRAPLGTKQNPDLCEYPDVLKELVYILYHDRTLHLRIFERLGVPSPSNLYRYKKYIAKKHQGSLGIYKVICAYLDLREVEEPSA